MMSHNAGVPPNLNLHHLAEAVADLVTNDLDDLYGQRMLDLRARTDGPQGDAVVAANNIAYLSSQLLPEIVRYQTSMIRMREEQLRQGKNGGRHTVDAVEDDVPW